MKRKQANRRWLACRSKCGTGNVPPQASPVHSLAQFSPEHSPEDAVSTKGRRGKNIKHPHIVRTLKVKRIVKKVG